MCVPCILPSGNVLLSSHKGSCLREHQPPIAWKNIVAADLRRHQSVKV